MLVLANAACCGTMRESQRKIRFDVACIIQCSELCAVHTMHFCELGECAGVYLNFLFMYVLRFFLSNLAPYFLHFTQTNVDLPANRFGVATTLWFVWSMQNGKRAAVAVAAVVAVHTWLILVRPFEICNVALVFLVAYTSEVSAPKRNFGQQWNARVILPGHLPFTDSNCTWYCAVGATAAVGYVCALCIVQCTMLVCYR